MVGDDAPKEAKPIISSGQTEFSSLATLTLFLPVSASHFEVRLQYCLTYLASLAFVVK
jgi:hypothetical protein